MAGIFAGLMLAGMIIGGTGTAVKQSTSDVKEACTQLNDANKNLASLQDQWAKINTGELKLENEVQEFQRNLQSSTDALNRSTIFYHNMYKKQQYAVITGIVGFLFLIFILLFLKKVKFYEKFKSLFSSNK
jgi:predicted PurR-regulated permease PerM